MPQVATNGSLYTRRGSTTNFTVLYENALGGGGPTLADAVLATCEADYDALDAWFGGVKPPASRLPST